MISDSERLEHLCTACLQNGLDVQMRATGLSMQPVICDGALIRIRPIAPAQVRLGDVILYRVTGGVIAHRVVTLIRHRGELTGLMTRGDASSTCDAPVHVQQVLGKVVEVDGQVIDSITAKHRLWLGLKGWFKPRNLFK